MYGKVKLTPCLAKHHVMKTFCGIHTEFCWGNLSDKSTVKQRRRWKDTIKINHKEKVVWM
jgi:hypothetical protein